jgi:hypothetical protein
MTFKRVLYTVAFSVLAMGSWQLMRPVGAYAALACCSGSNTCGVGNHCTAQGQGEMCCGLVDNGTDSSHCDYCDGGSE